MNKKILKLLILVILIIPNICNASNWKDLKRVIGFNEVETDAFTYSFSSENNKGKVKITLNEDIICDDQTLGRIGITNSNAVIDLNGHNIDRNLSEGHEDGYIFYVYNSTLTINDSVGTGKITGGYNTTGTTVIENPHTGAGAIIGYYSKITLNNGSITGNTAHAIGALNLYASTFTMNGGSITDNHTDGGYSQYDIGAINLYNISTMIMNGGTISNHKEAFVSAINVSHRSELTINGGTIENNTTRDNKNLYKNVIGTIYVNDNSKVTINDGTFRNNKNEGNGGVLSIDENNDNLSNVTINGGTFTENTATFGGVIYANESLLNVNGGTFTKNISRRGGVIYNNNSKVKVLGGTFTNNKSTEYGAAYYIAKIEEYTGENIFGKSVVMKNNMVNEIEDDLCLYAGNTIKIEDPTTMSIGVKVIGGTNVFITDEIEDYHEYLFSTNDKCEVIYNDSKIQIVSGVRVYIPNHEGLEVEVIDTNTNEKIERSYTSNEEKLSYFVDRGSNLTIKFNTKEGYKFEEEQEDIIINGLLDSKTINYNNIIKLEKPSDDIIINPQTGDNLIIYITLSILSLSSLLLIKKRVY